jgi:hypothetical protein
VRPEFKPQFCQKRKIEKLGIFAPLMSFHQKGATVFMEDGKEGNTH